MLIKLTTGVNFTNILRTAFNYKRVLCSFSLVTVWVCIFSRKDKAQKLLIKCLWNSPKILRSETDLVSKSCLDVYCESGTDSECPQLEEFKEFFVSETETKEDYEKRLDGLILDFVSKVFAEFKFNESSGTIRRKSSGNWTKFFCII